MQLIPRYLVNNRTTIVADVAGFITEYRPVYSREIQIHQGIDNVLEFKVLNADQKPISLTGYTPKFQAFDENQVLIIERTGVQLAKNGTDIKGVFSITITQNDLLNVKGQFLKYNIVLEDVDCVDTLTYTNGYFDASATIRINTDAMPILKDSKLVSTFLKVSEDIPYWVTSAVSAEPGINGNEALHTAAIYTNGYIGDVVVQATLDNQISDGTDWANVDTVTLNGNETEPTPINFNGIFNHLRFKATVDPEDKLTKILVRN